MVAPLAATQRHSAALQTTTLYHPMMAMMTSSSIRVAACHVSPVFLDAKRTTRKALGLIHRAVKNKANLVVFPETYIPAFPIWSALRSPPENHDLFKRMAKESVYADGPEIKAIRSAARDLNVMVSIGVSEKVHTSTATLYNSNLIIGGQGEVLVHHRKLMPTFFEKLTWAPGDGFGLRVADTRFGKIGALICGENTNPLARYSLMAQGEQVHISTWPAIWPTRMSNNSDNNNNNKNNNSNRDNNAAAEPGAAPFVDGSAVAKNYDNVAANRTRAAAHCFEAKCFGVLCSGMLGTDAIAAVTSGSYSPQLVSQALEQSQRGATMFLDPTGAPLQGFTVDEDTLERRVTDMLQSSEGILYADLDLDECIEGKQYHDVVGGYQRLDVFRLEVDRSRHDPVNFVEDTLGDDDEDVERSGKGLEEV